MNIGIDILELHSNILKNFEYEKNNVNEFKNKLNDLKKIDLDKLDFNIKNNLKKNIINLEIKIKDIENQKQSSFYIMESIEIIKSYSEILKKPKKVSFMGGISNINDNKKKELVKKYLFIVKKYIPNIKTPLLKIDNKHKKLKCSLCNKDIIEIDGFILCIECGKEEKIAANSSSYKDSERINGIIKYSYDKRLHFKDCINQYQGKQNSNVPPEIYKILEKEFNSHGLLIKSDKKDIKFSKITKKHILMFLKESGNSKYYEDCVLIHHTLTGISPPDISHLEVKILNDFDKLVETYEKIFKNKKKRKNFINNQYVLYQLLNKYNHKCNISDFNILKTVERKNEHDEICCTLFKELGWNFVSIF